MTGSQRGTIVAGTWLIALGGVFLVQQALDVPWGRAWPLFIVAAGIGSGVGALATMAGRRTGALVIAWALVWPILMVAVGALLFVDLADLVDVDAVGFLARWWPLGLVVIGLLVLLGAVWPRSRGIEERIEVPAVADLPGEVVVKFGAGTLDIGPGRTGFLVDGVMEGGGRRRDPGPNRVELETDILQVWPGFNRQMAWRLGLAPDVPMRLRLEGGASRSTLDLAELQVTDLVVKTGASDTRIVLPRRVDRCAVRVEAGAAQVTIEVPEGVAASIHATMGLGSTRVAEDRFPAEGSGRWRSPDFATAAQRAEIEVSGGVGSVRIA